MASEIPTADIRPMDVGEILDTTVRLLKIGWKPLLLTGLISALPMAVYNGLMLSLLPVASNRSGATTTVFFRAIVGAEAGDYSRLFELGGLFVVLLLVIALLTPWLHGALIVIASRLYLGLPATAGMGLRLAGRRYPALIGTYLLMTLFALLAIPALIIGGLFFLAFLTLPMGFAALACYSAFVGPALVVEGAPGGMAPIKRSFALVSRRFWPLLGLGFVAYLFVSVLGGQLGVITQVPAQLLLTFNKNPDWAPVLSWIVAISSALLATITGPLRYVALTLAYYDTRMRKEGLDLELLIRS